jgi:MoaA/NifB/PqqE/SkfB family radical SAM enzyme
MVEAHQRGLALFGEGRYQEAIGCFEECLRQAETSEVWNDWATAQYVSGHAGEAKEGLRRALQLDPQNSQAAENLRIISALISTPLVPSRHGGATSATPGSENPLLQNEAANQPTPTRVTTIVGELLRDIQSIPPEEPSLGPSVIAAMRTTGLDSGYFVQRCLEKLARLPAEALPKALEVLERCARVDYRLSLVLAYCYMQEEDYERALQHSRSACDRSPSDLFAENTLIACSHREAAKTGDVSEFDGLAGYLAKSFCEIPWRHLEISWQGNAFVCCPAWLPLRVGSVRTQALEEIWNSPFAEAIRKSILDGSFRYCSKLYCPKISGRTLPRRAGAAAGSESTAASAAGAINEYDAGAPGGPKKLILCYDKTCNLACPQCRAEFHVAGREEQACMDRDYLPLILRAAATAETVYLNGGGDFCVSKHSRHVLKLLKRDQFPNLKFLLISNGQALNEKTFRDLDLYGRVQGIEISIDAARPETYRMVRRGGDFRRLLSNLAILDDLRSSRGERFKLDFNFVVSSLNFREMAEFVQLGRRFHVDSIHFTAIRSWGHLSPSEFAALNVFNPCHPYHQEFLQVLLVPELSDPIVDCGSVEPYRRREKERDARRNSSPATATGDDA